MTEDYSIVGLFVSAFISSTLLPGGSEAVYLYLASQESHSLWLLWAIATIGNSLGGLTSWGIGYWVAYKFPNRAISEHKHKIALQRVRRWGPLSLLFSWLPIVGDPLCFVAGWTRISFLKSIVYISAGKAARYAALLLLLDIA